MTEKSVPYKTEVPTKPIKVFYCATSGCGVGLGIIRQDENGIDYLQEDDGHRSYWAAVPCHECGRLTIFSLKGRGLIYAAHLHWEAIAHWQMVETEAGL